MPTAAAEMVIVEHGWEAAAARRWARAGAEVVALTTKAAQALAARRLPHLLAEEVLTASVDLWARQAAERFAGVWYRLDGEDLSLYEGVSLGEMLRVPLIEALTEALRRRAAVEAIVRERRASAVAAARPLELSSLGVQQVTLDGWALRARQRIDDLYPAAMRLAKRVGLSGLRASGRARHRPTRGSKTCALIVMESLGAVAASLWPVMEEIERRGEIEARLFTGSLRVARALVGRRADFATIDAYLPPPARHRLAKSTRGLAADLHSTAAMQAARGVVGIAEIWDTAEPILRDVLKNLLADFMTCVQGSRRAIAQEDPDVILVGSAAHPLGYALAALARQAGVPTVEITHGIPVMEYAYLPVRTDQVAVWGPALRDWYLERGTDPARIAITGQPRFDRIQRSVPADGGAALRKQIGAAADAPIITLATNPVSDQENTCLLRAVLAAMREFPRHHLVIKMHPAERGQVQRRVVSECGVRASIVQGVDLYQLIAISEAVLTYHSTVGLEAMILDKPVVVINLSGLPDPAPYVERGAALAARSEAEIVGALKRALDGSRESLILAEARRRFVADFAGETDGRAASRVVDLLYDMGRSAPHAHPRPRRGGLVGRYFDWNRQMQPDAALRHLPIADRLRRTLGDGAVVCDVGSGGRGIGSYLRCRLVALDIDIGGLRAAREQGRGRHGASVGSVTAMPFRDRAFDAVVAVDMLEHLKAADRAAAIREMIRCARRQVVIALPCGAEAEAAEARIARGFRRRHARAHLWLAEHAAHGLPTEGEISGMIEAGLATAGRPASGVIVRDNVDRSIWSALQRLDTSRLGMPAWLVGRPLCLLARPLLRRFADCRRGRGYRKIFYIDLSEESHRVY